MNRKCLIALFCVLFQWTFSTPCSAALHLKTQDTQVNMLELFSSEGCATCATSETFLSGLRARSGLWTNFVPIEFHLDPKNKLQWNDPVTQTQLPVRMKGYAAQWGMTTISAPFFALNGSEWNKKRPISDVAEKRGTKVGVMSVDEIAENEFEISFQAYSRAPDWVANVALLGNGLSGHEFLVLQTVKQTMEKRGDRFWALLQLAPYDLKQVKSMSAAFWISQINEVRPEQATGGELLVKSQITTH